MFLVTEAIMTGLLLFNFETTKCKNPFEHKFGQNPFRVYGDNVIFMFCATGIFSNGTVVFLLE